MIERRHEALRSTTKIAAAVGLLFVAAPDAGAQSADYTEGAAIWNTGFQSFGPCSDCHRPQGSAPELGVLRTRIITMFGALNVMNARTLLNSAILNRPQMSFYGALPDAQRNDVANYLADFRGFGTIAPSATLNFNASPSTQRVTLTNSGSAMLRINTNNGVTLEGPDPADFQATQVGNGCQAITLAPNSSCAVDVRFMTSATGTRVAELVFNHDGNPSINRVQLVGTAAGSPPPPPPPPPSGGDGGGGATEPTTLWSLLAVAALFARRKLLPQSH